MRPTSPRPSFPPRAPGSVRRVMHLDYDWIDFADVRVTGGARDEVADAGGGVQIVDESSVRFETRGRLLTIAEVEPAAFDGKELLGDPLQMGFRRRVREVHDADGGTLGLLLDDVSGAMIAAGYVHAMQGSIDPEAMKARATAQANADPGYAARAFTQADYCSGWRSDGAMMISVRAGEPMRFLPVPPVTEHPEGSDGWPVIPIPTPGLRRHRRIDVVPDGSVWRIDAWFRDTYRNRDGVLGALHEYTVELTVDAKAHTLLEVRAIPHALPWNECPPAADAVTKLVGQPIEGLRSSVPQTLHGLESCTHLTNELRELADVPHMVARI